MCAVILAIDNITVDALHAFTASPLQPFTHLLKEDTKVCQSIHIQQIRQSKKLFFNLFPKSNVKFVLI